MDNIFERLKLETRQVHERVEGRLRIFAPDFDVPAYVRLLMCFHGFWSPVETELRKVADLAHPELHFPSRLKAHLLEDDLRFFGIDPEVLRACTRIPCVATLERALGCLYVLEGSTLGAQFIARHLRERLNIDAGAGGSFFNAYGGEVPRRWAEFRTFVTDQARSLSRDDIVAGACETFHAFDAWVEQDHECRGSAR